MDLKNCFFLIDWRRIVSQDNRDIWLPRCVLIEKPCWYLYKLNLLKEKRFFPSRSRSNLSDIMDLKNCFFLIDWRRILFLTELWENIGCITGSQGYLTSSVRFNWKTLLVSLPHSSWTSRGFSDPERSLVAPVWGSNSCNYRLFIYISWNTTIFL